MSSVYSTRRSALFFRLGYGLETVDFGNQSKGRTILPPHMNAARIINVRDLADCSGKNGYFSFRIEISCNFVPWDTAFGVVPDMIHSETASVSPTFLNAELPDRCRRMTFLAALNSAPTIPRRIRKHRMVYLGLSEVSGLRLMRLWFLANSQSMEMKVQ